MKRIFVISKFWLFIILPFINAILPELEWPYYIEVKKYQQCEEHPNSKVLFQNLRIDRVALDNYTVSGLINVTEDLQAPQYMGVKAEKCKDNPSSCQQIFSQVLQDLCADMKNKHSKGYEIMHVHLEFKESKCPIKKGVHEIVSKEFDTKSFQAAGTTANYWKLHLYFYEADKKTVSSCIHFEIAIIKKEQRQKQRKMGNKTDN